MNEQTNGATFIKVGYLGGTCRNGGHKDAGTRYHAVQTDSDADTGKFPFYGRALCGQKSGRSSYGWAQAMKPDQRVTCPRCLAKLQRGADE